MRETKVNFRCVKYLVLKCKMERDIVSNLPRISLNLFISSEVYRIVNDQESNDAPAA